MGPYLEQLYMVTRKELRSPVWDSFTGLQPGLLTNENKKASELYWGLQLDTNKQNGKKKITNYFSKLR